MDHPLVELARSAIDRLQDAPSTADAAVVARAELDRAADRPFAVGVTGERAARTQLFDALLGRGILDPARPGGPLLRARRGRTTRVRAVFHDGRVEEIERPPERPPELVAATSRAETARRVAVQQETALARIDGAIPPIARARPAVWAIWLWPIYWIARWLARRRFAERRAANDTLLAARVEVETAVREATAVEHEAQAQRTRYRDTIRTWSSGEAGVVGPLELVLASGPLPEGLALAELPDTTPDADTLDAVLVVLGDTLYAPAPDGGSLALATIEDALPRLDAIALQARAISIARSASATVQDALRSLEQQLEREDAAFRDRLAALEARRLRDPSTFIEQQITNAGAQIVSCVSAVIEHSSTHLAAEMAELQAEWIGMVARATTNDELKAAISTITDRWSEQARRIGSEVRVLVIGGLSGSARDIYPSIVEPLVAYGLPAEHAGPLRTAPKLPPLELLPSLATTQHELDVPGWLSGLFRSFESRRTQVREKLHERIEHLRDVAAAELLDAEPRMQVAIADALRPMMSRAIDQQTAALDDRVEAERAKIAQERVALAPLVRARDAIRAELDRLLAELQRIEDAQAPIARAAQAATPSR